MALNGLICADVPLSNYSLTHSHCQTRVNTFDMYEVSTLRAAIRFTEALTLSGQRTPTPSK